MIKRVFTVEYGDTASLVWLTPHNHCCKFPSIGSTMISEGILAVFVDPYS
jgi:hypothetical protein